MYKEKSTVKRKFFPDKSFFPVLSSDKRQDVNHKFFPDCFLTLNILMISDTMVAILKP